MKLLIILLFTLTLSLNAFAAIDDKVDDCYSQNNSTESASYCADMEIARAIKRLNRKVNRGDRGDRGDRNEETSTIYQCSADGDPILQKLIIDDSGQVLRTSNIRTYTEGDDNHEKMSCGRDVLKKSVQISSALRTECVCSGDGDPILQLVLMTKRFEEVKKVNLFTFTDGDDNHERRSCERAVQTEALCQLN